MNPVLGERQIGISITMNEVSVNSQPGRWEVQPPPPYWEGTPSEIMRIRPAIIGSEEGANPRDQVVDYPGELMTRFHEHSNGKAQGWALIRLLPVLRLLRSECCQFLFACFDLADPWSFWIRTVYFPKKIRLALAFLRLGFGDLFIRKRVRLQPAYYGKVRRQFRCFETVETGDMEAISSTELQGMYVKSHFSIIVSRLW